MSNIWKVEELSKSIRIPSKAKNSFFPYLIALRRVQGNRSV